MRLKNGTSEINKFKKMKENEKKKKEIQWDKPIKVYSNEKYN